MDSWLSAIAADTSSTPKPIKIVNNKPPSLVDGCWVGGATPAFVAETQFLGGVGTSFCNDQYPAATYPRFVAGGALTNDVVKCQLKAPTPSDYNVTFTRAEWGRLRAIFRSGVCDWSRPGDGQTGLLSPWMTFTGVGHYKKDNGH